MSRVRHSENAVDFGSVFIPGDPLVVKLSRIGQIAVNVRNAQRAIAFYRDTLGMEFLFEVPGMGFFNCDGIRLMLSEVESADFNYPASIIYYGVEDIHATYETLSQGGVVFTSPPRKIASVAEHDLWMAFFKDPDDNVLGLMSEILRPE
ncbi:MAG: methylmalonyl-CoA epimerase [Schlesneria sp.]|nr:methylmalonyl-CoA epimerase [Schlesneria sp.]